MRIYIFFFKLAGVRPASISFVPRALALSLSKAALFVVNEEWGSREEGWTARARARAPCVDKEGRGGAATERRAHTHAASKKKDGAVWPAKERRTLRRKRRMGRGSERTARAGARCAGKERWVGAAKERRTNAHAASRRRRWRRVRYRCSSISSSRNQQQAAAAAAEIREQQQQQKAAAVSSSSRKQQQ